MSELSDEGLLAAYSEASKPDEFSEGWFYESRLAALRAVANAAVVAATPDREALIDVLAEADDEGQRSQAEKRFIYGPTADAVLALLGGGDHE